MNNEQVILQLGSERHSGWQEVTIRLSLEQIADEFQLTLTERWSESGDMRLVSPDQPCTLHIDDELVLTGYLDEVLPDYDATTHTIVANGRSKAGDLVDCSGQEQRLNGRTLQQIAQVLAQPYGIEVVDMVGATKPLRSFVLEDGQPIAEAIERAAQLRGARVVSDAQGRLLIVHAVQREIKTALVLGENIRSASGTFSNRDRFNQYIVEGQTPGDNDWHGTNASGPRGTAHDPQVRKPRTTLVVCDTPADQKDCAARAELEARMRWAQGRGVTYTVSGWKNEQGVWRPGDLVHVKDAYLGLDEQLLVSAVQLIDGLDGRRTELRMVPPLPLSQCQLRSQKKSVARLQNLIWGGKKVDRRTMSRLLSPIWRRMRLLISRGVLQISQDDNGLQEVQITLQGDSPAWAERFQTYGLTSVPHGGAEAVVAAVGGARAHLVALAIDDRRYRLTGLKTGEVAIYDDLGQSVHLTRDGIVISGAGLPLSFVDCPVVTMDGDLEVAGEVRDHTSTMQAMRDIYNGHAHGGGQKPDQEMS